MKIQNRPRDIRFFDFGKEIIERDKNTLPILMRLIEYHLHDINKIIICFNLVESSVGYVPYITMEDNQKARHLSNCYPINTLCRFLNIFPNVFYMPIMTKEDKRHYMTGTMYAALCKLRENLPVMRSEIINTDSYYRIIMNVRNIWT